MKQYVKSFITNGLFVCGLGPVVWAIVYAILAYNGVIDMISVDKVVFEIVSVTVLAFIAGGVVVIYKVERLPLVVATLIHALVLYIDYIVIYLMNGWLGKDLTPLLVFTSCFAVGFTVIWLVVYFTTKKNADEINSLLVEMQSKTE